jgi:hypothetical protein
VSIFQKFLEWLSSLFGSGPAPTTPPPIDNTPTVPKITRLQPFRTTPVVSSAVFSKVLSDAKSPMLEEAGNIRDAVRGNPLPLAQSFRESQYGKDASAQRNHNPLGLLWYAGCPITTYESIIVSPTVTIRLLKFPTWAAAFAEWQRRMDDPNYRPGAPGAYQPADLSLEKFIFTYVGGPQCFTTGVCGNGETPASCRSYLNDTVDRINRYYTLTAPSVPTDPDDKPLVFGKVPLPKFNDKRIKDQKNRAWDLLGARLVRGVVLHRMLGSKNGTYTYFTTVPGGNAANCPAGVDTTYINGGCNGLTDWGIDASSGDCDMWNSPTGYPTTGVSANRAPWASGPYAGVPGDGKDYVDKFGVNSINRDLPSVEISGQYNDPISEACKQKVVDIVSYHADQAKVPWSSFPMNPATGETFLFYHWEFCGKATKICPGPVVEAFLPDLIARVKVVLNEWQTGKRT